MRETFAIKVMTTDTTNLLTEGKFRMRKSYSITGVGAGLGLRGCTQDARAGMPYQPSSRRRPGSPVARASATRAYVRPRDWEGCHRVVLLRTVTVLARPPGLRAAEPGLGPLKNLGEPTAAGGRNLGLRRFRRRRLRQRGSRTMREPFGRPLGECLGCAAPVRTIIPHGDDPGRFFGVPGPLPR